MSEHRLIYADELLEVFEQYLDEMQYVEESISKSARLSLIKWVIDKTNEQPTAYDIDKVVEEIKHQIQLEFDWLRAVKHEEGHINLSDLDIAERAMKSKAIEIVKGGAE